MLKRVSFCYHSIGGSSEAHELHASRNFCLLTANILLIDEIGTVGKQALHLQRSQIARIGIDSLTMDARSPLLFFLSCDPDLYRN